MNRKEYVVIKNFNSLEKCFFRSFSNEIIQLEFYCYSKTEPAVNYPFSKNYYPDGNSQDKLLKFSSELASIEIELISQRRNKISTRVFKATKEGKLFYIALPKFETVGKYQIRIFYTFQDGKTIEEMPAYLFIDPSHIKELKICSFVPAICGTIEDWKPEILRLKNLGINTLHILPITPCGPTHSPYSASNLFTIAEPYFSKDTKSLKKSFYLKSKYELNNFVNFLREHGLRLCVDIVLNHAAVEGDFVRDHKNLFNVDPSENDNIKRAGWSDDKNFYKWEDLASINYEPFLQSHKTEIWRIMYKYTLFWASFAAKTDGMIRLDNLHSSFPPFVSAICKKISERFPNLTLLGEMFSYEENLISLSWKYGIHLLLATPWEHKFVPQLRNYIKYLHQKGNQLRYIFPITSHDSGSPVQEFGDINSTIPRFAASALFGAGPSGLTLGVEYGYLEKIKFIDIPHKENLEDKKTADYSNLIAQNYKINSNPEYFQRPGNIIFVDGDHEAVIGAIRFNAVCDSPIFYLILSNFDTRLEQVQTITVTKDQLIKALPPFCRKTGDFGFQFRNQIEENQKIEIITDYHFHLKGCEVLIFKGEALTNF